MKKLKQDEFSRNSRNAMEMLVAEEVEQQIQSLPPRIAKNIQPSEVIAYALNRLPGLYATTKRGWQHQLNRGRIELCEQVRSAVRQAIIAVQRDPLRTDPTLAFEEENAALAALEKLKIILQHENLTWQNLPDVVEESLQDTLRGKITWRNNKQPVSEIFNWNDHSHHH